jgi:MFS family permease
LIFTGYIAPGLAQSGLLSTTTETFFGLKGIAGFIAATFAGLFVGTFFLGFLPDRYGRKLIFTFALLWYSIGSFAMAFQTTPEGIILCDSLPALVSASKSWRSTCTYSSSFRSTCADAPSRSIRR